QRVPCGVILSGVPAQAFCASRSRGFGGQNSPRGVDRTLAGARESSAARFEHSCSVQIEARRSACLSVAPAFVTSRRLHARDKQQNNVARRLRNRGGNGLEGKLPSRAMVTERPPRGRRGATCGGGPGFLAELSRIGQAVDAHAEQDLSARLSDSPDLAVSDRQGLRAAGIRVAASSAAGASRIAAAQRAVADILARGGAGSLSRHPAADHPRSAPRELRVGGGAGSVVSGVLYPVRNAV